MRVKTVLVLLIALAGCKNEHQVKKGNAKAIKIEASEINAGNVETQELNPNLEFNYISDLIQSTFKNEKFQPSTLFNRVEGAYQKVLDLGKIETIQEYSDFLLIELKDSKVAKIEFGKLRALAKLTGRERADEFHDLFRKGGISFNLVENWIVAHYLRCSMDPNEYELDKRFTSELEKSHTEVDWIRSYCGWSKLEMK